MSAPEFLSVEQVERFHLQGLEKFGGAAGVRDRNLLESAVRQPMNVYFYGRGDLFEIAVPMLFISRKTSRFLTGTSGPP